MKSEVHNDTAPDSGGGASAFETMVTKYREGQEKTGPNNWSAPRVGIPKEHASCTSSSDHGTKDLYHPKAEGS